MLFNAMDGIHSIIGSGSDDQINEGGLYGPDSLYRACQGRGRGMGFGWIGALMLGGLCSSPYWKGAGDKEKAALIEQARTMNATLASLKQHLNELDQRLLAIEQSLDNPAVRAVLNERTEM